MLATHYFDANWVDAGSIAVAVAYAIWQHAKSDPPRKLISR